MTEANSHPTLMELYRQDLQGLGIKDRSERRMHWRHAVIRFLAFNRLTADKPPELHQTKDGITTVPNGAIFIRASKNELEQIYRLTSPKRVNPS